MTILHYAYSSVSDRYEPMEWVIPYGDGRVYTTLLGHVAEGSTNITLRCVGFQTTFIRGVEWAGIGDVTFSLPDNFPNDSTIILNNNLPGQ